MTKQFVGLPKAELDTPCLVIEREKLFFNLKKMQQHAIKNKVNIRPHCKTHKCSQLAKLQIEHGAIGLSVAKVSEAEILINKGLRGILITSPIVSKYKITRLLNCLKKAPDTMVVLDNQQNLAELNEAGALIQQKINVLVDVDPGIGRTGIKPHLALDLGRQIARSQWLNLKGIQCYAGNLQHIFSYEERKERSLQIMQLASEIVIDFRNDRLPCDILTGSGTGTYDIDIAASEITEIQPGSYTVMDVEYATIGSKAHPERFDNFQHAMSLLTTVISSNRNEHVTVDAGTKAIYVDLHIKPKIISHPHLIYDWGGFGDEHGKIMTTDNGPLPTNKDVLELIVPHCDPTINLYDKFYVVSKGIVVDVWDIDLRGACQ
ncbi:DSD1 family PLP-dependent enzyme [Legionella micdadei]|uniref:Alanine racemase n=1 Tax=Legionella micdadei TaxID=451 RepID=A0A098GIU8_LEGMI|nr:DSD1 family PLP-dependent enzyme [Legionella micdadei]ARG96693.1 metal-activated pyridoxal enzyme [Legionella micdadei]ARG99440.1 metal-activated pyridoxal enzyme [Legionella micdadei]KTD26358.1 alanine racemase [Legionella micdadei]NSL19066.1 DSD1 family PLP-dependent enzyme [Legionella micdadei]CEG61927.1 Alanine racemase [Legionella micdadei]